ncbi:MAG TPA: arylamine N-acetyltransferase [Rhodobacteraceae bacterium]|jgi:N-hydroxyarylamine O-acetyltransferase|nr:arylamine N-acetyltransferase [Paracoccaceae bacterium]
MLFPMRDFDLSAYLRRIGLAPVAATPEGLRTLQTAQLRALPFESIDPYLGRLPATDLPAIAAKIVTGGRGGYCFELNALLHAAMQALGFAPRRHLARVRKGLPRGGPRSHLMMTCRLDGETWLADAGCGGPGPLVPLRADEDAPQQAPNGRYRLWTDAATGERVLDKETGDGWFPLYGFDAAHVGDMDIEAANYICATWSAMPFPNHLMLAGFDGDTRIGLFDRQLTLGTRAGETREELADADAFAALASGRLGLRLDDTELAAIWNRLSRTDGR